MIEILCYAVTIYYFILLARVILSWVGHRVPDGLRPVAGLVFAATEPLLKIFRPLIPPLRVGMVALDISIILIFILLGFVQTAVC